MSQLVEETGDDDEEADALLREAYVMPMPGPGVVANEAMMDGLHFDQCFDPGGTISPGLLSYPQPYPPSAPQTSSKRDKQPLIHTSSCPEIPSAPYVHSHLAPDTNCYSSPGIFVLTDDDIDFNDHSVRCAIARGKLRLHSKNPIEFPYQRTRDNVCCDPDVYNKYMWIDLDQLSTLQKEKIATAFMSGLKFRQKKKKRKKKENRRKQTSKTLKGNSDTETVPIPVSESGLESMDRSGDEGHATGEGDGDDAIISDDAEDENSGITTSREETLKTVEDFIACLELTDVQCSLERIVSWCYPGQLKVSVDGRHPKVLIKPRSEGTGLSMLIQSEHGRDFPPTHRACQTAFVNISELGNLPILKPLTSQTRDDIIERFYAPNTGIQRTQNSYFMFKKALSDSIRLLLVVLKFEEVCEDEGVDIEENAGPLEEAVREKVLRLLKGLDVDSNMLLRFCSKVWEYNVTAECKSIISDFGKTACVEVLNEVHPNYELRRNSTRDNKKRKRSTS